MTKYIHTDNYEWLKSREDNSIDSIVTDSPYGLGKEPDPVKVLSDWINLGYHEIKGSGFMGKKWDAFVPQPILWRECLRVLKPGGYLLSFFGTRTYDWGTMAIRLAGFEIRDQIAWVYGSGFPKSHNLEGDYHGWGTALKPAMEPIVIARKALIGTVADNIKTHNTGAMNIDGCRIALNGDYKSKANGRPSQTGLDDLYNPDTASQCDDIGRWPANIIHDGSDEVMELFPLSNGQQGDLKETGKNRPTRIAYGNMAPPKAHKARTESDRSSARFFYCAKPSKAERNKGAELFKKINGHNRFDKCGNCGGYILQNTERPSACKCESPSREDNEVSGNHHPTVKPVALMRYLVRLVTPKSGLCLDLFCGSGTTGIASELEGIDCICLDNDAEYIKISEARAKAWRSPLFSE